MMKNFPSLTSNRMMLRVGVVVAASAFMVGCASDQAPTEQMAVSKAAVNNAMSAGSNEFAPVQLKSAMDKLDAAEKAMADKNYELARQLAEQAEVDAKLAGAMARSAKAQKAANAVQDDIRVLRQEIDRNSK
jgi:septal ring factor EnvC (AmiA/AmiB activator)